MYKLLIVDDEETILEGIMTAVPWAEFDVSVSGTARNGLEALAFLEAETVDIILTDISMPLMDGLELAKTVRQRWPQVHVMILTGYDEFDYARRAIEYGVDAFLLKPVGIEELEEQLGRIKIKIREKQAQDRRLNNSEQIIFERSQALTDAFLLDLVYDKNIDKQLLEEQAEVLNLPDTSGLWQCVFLEIRALQNPIHTKQTVSSKLL